MMVARGLAVLIAPLALLLGGAGSVEASCIAPQPLPDMIAAAKVVFVGTVIYTSDGDRQARVGVEAIWKGPSLPSYVDVYGSPVSGPWASSVDRYYQAGQRYLFVLYSDARPLQDNSCSATQPYTSELAAYAPSDTRVPDPATLDDELQNLIGQYRWPALILVVLVVVAVAVAVLLRRRARRI